MSRLRLLLESAADLPVVRAPSYRPDAAPVARSSRPVTAVVMELAGVLYDDTLWPRWLWQQLGRLGLQSPFEAFWQVFQLEHLPPAYAGRVTFWQALAAYLSEVGFSRGRIEEVQIAAEARRRQWETELRPLPGVASTLSQLSARRIPLLILTNASCDGQQLRRRLRTLGLESHFQEVVSSIDLGAALPHERAWQTAVERLGRPPAQLALLSRNSQVLAGAGQAGLLPVSVHGPLPVSGALQIDRFADLLDILPPPENRSRAA